jgi:hypothetical protein
VNAAADDAFYVSSEVRGSHTSSTKTKFLRQNNGPYKLTFHKLLPFTFSPLYVATHQLLVINRKARNKMTAVARQQHHKYTLPSGLGGISG